MQEDTQEQTYEPPALIDLGDVRELTLGAGAQDTADLNAARYY